MGQLKVMEVSLLEAATSRLMLCNGRPAKFQRNSFVLSSCHSSTFTLFLQEVGKLVAMIADEVC